ncbi:MAG: ABC transporter permease [Acidipropionibacterium sp.]|jgi:ABC-2 type transport system permease protein|nr:ABC transporter permease [Acidipropionibacterium sp.]
MTTTRVSGSSVLTGSPSSTTPPVGFIDAAARSVPRFGGFSATLIRIELLRVVRNRRTMVLAILLPIVLFLLVGNGSYGHLPYGRGTVAGMIMIGIALYGAIISTVGAGAAVSVERSAGWSRQLRLTPLSPMAYVLVKAMIGMFVGALSIIAVCVTGVIKGLDQPLDVTLAAAALAWLGSGLFAAFGLFMGYLLPTDNAMQFINMAVVMLAFLSGMFIPIDPASVLGHIARFAPMWGIHQLALVPFGTGGFGVGELINIVVWLAIFVGGAAWLMSRDTARV